MIAGTPTDGAECLRKVWFCSGFQIVPNVITGEIFARDQIAQAAETIRP
jgi:hypothetical protein